MGTLLAVLSAVFAVIVLATPSVSVSTPAPAPAPTPTLTPSPAPASNASGVARLERSLQERVVGGKRTSIKEYPFMVSVQLNKRHICGGSLYTTRLVLTAAHCTYESSGAIIASARRRGLGHLSVVMGTTNRRDFEETAERRGVVLAWPHEKFNPEPRSSLQYDIALLLLSHEMILSDVVKLVPLKKSTDPMPQGGEKCTVVGWGHTEPISLSGKPTKKSPSNLRKVELDCLEKCPKTKYQRRHVCAYTPHKDACMGDSGGPFLCNGVEVALVSFGYGCAQDDPGYYYRVDDEKWLKKAERHCLRGGCRGGRVACTGWLRVGRNAALAAVGVWLGTRS